MLKLTENSESIKESRQSLLKISRIPSISKSKIRLLAASQAQITENQMYWMFNRRK